MSSFHFLPSLLLIAYINGESIPITNAGFEEDDPYLVPNSNSNPNELIGWTLYDPLGTNRQDSPGVSHPGACDKCSRSNQGVSFNDAIYGDSTPEGDACLYMWGASPGGEFGVQQELLSTLEPLTSYTLSVKVGNQGYNCWTQWNGGTVDWCDSCDGFIGYIVQLVAGDTIVAQDDNSISIADQQWQTITVHYGTSSSDIAMGEALKIRLLAKNDETATDACIMYDDVTLTADTSTTSTSSTALPTTTLPTTVLPTTSLPTTALPTTVLPTTLLPTATLSTTILPTTALPTTELAATEFLTTELTSTALSTEALSSTSFPTIVPRYSTTQKPLRPTLVIMQSTPNVQTTIGEYSTEREDVITTNVEYSNEAHDDTDSKEDAATLIDDTTTLIVVLIILSVGVIVICLCTSILFALALKEYKRNNNQGADIIIAQMVQAVGSDQGTTAKQKTTRSNSDSSDSDDIFGTQTQTQTQTKVNTGELLSSIHVNAPRVEEADTDSGEDVTVGAMVQDKIFRGVALTEVGPTPKKCIQRDNVLPNDKEGHNYNENDDGRKLYACT